MAGNKVITHRICDFCGKDVEICHKERLAHKNIFCSKDCEGAFRRQESAKRKEQEFVICPICKKEFYIKPSHRNGHNYCSKACFAESKKETFKGENNHQYGLKGELNSSWKSDERINFYGYKLIRKVDHPFRNSDGFVFEHRLIAEQFLLTQENSIEIEGKYYLKPELIVHHKDGNKLNNNPDNLEIMTRAEHTQMHVKKEK